MIVLLPSAGVKLDDIVLKVWKKKISFWFKKNKTGLRPLFNIAVNTGFKTVCMLENKEFCG